MNRAGSYVTNLEGKTAYQSFRPASLPPMPALALDDNTIQLLIAANAQLAKLDAAAALLPNTDLFATMYVRKEALLSSQIEGTQCTLDDVLDPEISANANADVEDVENYVKATSYAIDRLQELPLCNRLLRETHAVLLEGARGEDKNPGEFRTSQNWIGPAACTLAEARYVPPNVDDMNDAMTALETYCNNDESYDALIQIALIHYQFETIHPFLDGNGRVGRLLVLLYLLNRGMLHKPVLYVSYFLKKNQLEYYDRMSEVRRTGNYEQWVQFFLEALCAAAKDSYETIVRLSALHDANVAKLPKTTRAKNTTVELFAYLEQHPIITVGPAAKDLGVSFNTAASAVKKLVELGILQETTNASRSRVFAYEEYLAILRPGTE